METDARINLLVSPLRTRFWASTWFWMALVVVLAYGVMIGMGYGAYKARQQAQERNALLLDSIRRQGDLLLLVSDIMASQKAVEEKALKIKKLEGRRVLVTEVCRRVEKMLPDGTRFTELSIDGKGVDMKGIAPDYTAVALVLHGLTQQSLFNGADLVRCGETADGEVCFHIQTRLTGLIRESER